MIDKRKSATRSEARFQLNLLCASKNTSRTIDASRSSNLDFRLWGITHVALAGVNENGTWAAFHAFTPNFLGAGLRGGASGIRLHRRWSWSRHRTINNFDVSTTSPDLIRLLAVPSPAQ